MGFWVNSQLAQFFYSIWPPFKKGLVLIPCAPFWEWGFLGPFGFPKGETSNPDSKRPFYSLHSSHFGHHFKEAGSWPPQFGLGTRKFWAFRKPPLLCVLTNILQDIPPFRLGGLGFQLIFVS